MRWQSLLGNAPTRRLLELLLIVVLVALFFRWKFNQERGNQQNFSTATNQTKVLSSPEKTPGVNDWSAVRQLCDHIVVLSGRGEEITEVVSRPRITNCLDFLTRGPQSDWGDRGGVGKDDYQKAQAVLLFKLRERSICTLRLWYQKGWDGDGMTCYQVIYPGDHGPDIHQELYRSNSPGAKSDDSKFLSTLGLQWTGGQLKRSPQTRL